MKKMRYRSLWSVAFGAGLLSLGSLVFGQMEISRLTVNGGGGHATGGGFELSYTFGQPEAGTSTGGTIELHAAFWFPIVPGDCANDGGIGLTDFAAFSDCTSGPQGAITDPACSCLDFDHDSDIDLTDFAMFQSSFSG